MNIESWCAVECNSNQQWTRAERKHCQNAFSSSVFDSSEAQRHTLGRSDWSTTTNVDIKVDNIKKKRSFPQKCELL